MTQVENGVIIGHDNVQVEGRPIHHLLYLTDAWRQWHQIYISNHTAMALYVITAFHRYFKQQLSDLKKTHMHMHD